MNGIGAGHRTIGHDFCSGIHDDSQHLLGYSPQPFSRWVLYHFDESRIHLLSLLSFWIVDLIISSEAWRDYFYPMLSEVGYYQANQSDRQAKCSDQIISGGSAERG